MTAYHAVGLTMKLHHEQKDALLQPILKVLAASGVEVFVDGNVAEGMSCVRDLPRIGSVQDLDVLIVVGGDGTVLRTIREWKPGPVPILAINAGSVGFLSEMPLSDVPTRLSSLLTDGGILERRSCLDAEVLRDERIVFSCTALNDVVIAQGAISRLLDLHVAVSGQFLTTYHADGLIVATPTGSTAYSLAAGGPVVHPTVSALILTPINPHGFTQKPIVLPGDVSIAVSLSGAVPMHANASVGLTIDGQSYEELAPGDRVTVHTGCDVHFLRSRDTAFYHALRTKLKWGEGSEN